MLVSAASEFFSVVDASADTALSMYWEGGGENFELLLTSSGSFALNVGADRSIALRAGTPGLFIDSKAQVDGELTVTGNLVVNGTTTTVDTENLTVEDPLIKLAKNNTASDTIDIGFYGSYFRSGSVRYTGLAYDASDQIYKFFRDTTVEPTTTVNLGGTGFEYATIAAGAVFARAAGADYYSVLGGTGLVMAWAAGSFSLYSETEDTAFIETSGSVKIKINSSLPTTIVNRAGGTALRVDTALGDSATLVFAVDYNEVYTGAGVDGLGRGFFNEVWLPTGGSLNFGSSNVVLTHSTGVLTVGTGSLAITTPGTSPTSVVTRTTMSERWCQPHGAAAPSTSGATTATLTGSATSAEQIPVWSFSGSANQIVDFFFRLPPSYSGNGLTITYLWTSAVASATDVTYQISFRSITPDDNRNFNTATFAYAFYNSTIAGPSVAYELCRTTFTLTHAQILAAMQSGWTMTAGDFLVIRVRRIGATDANTNATLLLSVTAFETP